MTPDVDPRSIVTPYAFTVADTLLHRPLASPMRRALALFIDLLLVLLLAELSLSVLLTTIVLVALFRWHGWQVGRAITTSVFAAMGLWLAGAVVIELLPESWAHELRYTRINDATDLGSNRTNIASDSPLGLGLSWAALYFSLFTARFKGQTLGKRIMRIQVRRLDNQPLSLWEAFSRYGGYGAGIATGMLGFIQIFWDPNRQGIHDKIASTVVIDLRSNARANARRERRKLISG